MKTMTTRGLVAAIAGMIFMAGCGSSTEPDESAQQQPGVSTGVSGSPATGAANGGAAGAGTTSVMCGAMTCTNPAAGSIAMLKMFVPSAMLATPCCLADGGCGWVGAGGACTAPPDKAMCPAPSIPGFGMLSGCCIESSQTCGIDSSAIGLGCMASMFGGGSPTKCDGTKVAPPAAGTTGSAAGSGAAAGTGATSTAAGSGAAGSTAGGAAGATAGGAAGSTAAGSAGRSAAGAGGTTGSSAAGAGSTSTSGSAGRAAGAGAGGR